MNTKRIEYFDALKGFAMLLVVFCHHVVLNAESILGNIVMSFAWAAVPCFFMVTGGLMHKAKEFKWKKWLMRIFKIYAGMVVWKLLYWMFYAFIGDVVVNIGEFINYLFFMGKIVGVDTGPIWFIETYLQILIFFPITYQLYSKSKIVYMMIILGYTWMFGIFRNSMNLLGVDTEPFLSKIAVFDESTNMLFYFIFGVVLLHYRQEINAFFQGNIFRKSLPLILITIGGVGVLLIKYADTGSFRWNGVYLTDGYNRISTMFMAIGLYLSFSLEMISGKCSKLLAKIGSHTMGIFYLHYPVMIVLKIIIAKLVTNIYEYYSFQLNVLQTIVVVIICCGITFVAKRIPLVKHLFV